MGGSERLDVDDRRSEAGPSREYAFGGRMNDVISGQPGAGLVRPWADNLRTTRPYAGPKKSGPTRGNAPQLTRKPSITSGAASSGTPEHTGCTTAPFKENVYITSRLSNARNPLSVMPNVDAETFPRVV